MADLPYFQADGVSSKAQAVKLINGMLADLNPTDVLCYYGSSADVAQMEADFVRDSKTLSPDIMWHFVQRAVNP